MKKRQLITVAALAVALSVGCANATNVSGAVKSGNVYTSNPENIQGSVGYRKYDHFNVSKGDVLNLNFRGKKMQGGKEVTKDVSSFINLVGSKVQIDGVLNSVKDGKFYNGNAIFITPEGFAVGSTGVVNVGQLHVATPSTSDYNRLIKGYGTSDGFRAINQVSSIKNKSVGDVQIDGKVFTKDGIDMRGQNIVINGHLVNGVKNQDVLTSKSQADALFNTLVNTEGRPSSSYGFEAINHNPEFEQNGSLILIKAKDRGGITTGEGSTIMNASGEGVYLTNDGSKGMDLNGRISAQKVVNIYNKAGDLKIGKDGKFYVYDGKIDVANKGNDLVVAEGAKLGEIFDEDTTSRSEVYITQNGKGEMVVNADISVPDNIAINNKKGSSMTVGGNIRNVHGDIAINNYNGDMTVNSNFIASTGLSAESSTVLAINNKAKDGKLTFNGDIDTQGDMVKIANAGKGGMEINGRINVDGYQSSNGLEGGHIYIVNNNGEMKFSKLARVTTNENAPWYVIDSHKIGNTGNISIQNKDNGTGLTIERASIIQSNHGDIAIKNKSGQDGTTINGQITAGKMDEEPHYENYMYAEFQSDKTVAINNYAGDLNIGGKIGAKNIGIINREGGKDLTIANNADIYTPLGYENQINIKHNGSGDMTVNGEFYVDGGRVNVIANEGQLNLGAKVGAIADHFGGTFYAASRYNSTGMNVTKDFSVKGMDVILKNYNGENGLNFEGKISGGEPAGVNTYIINKTGDLNINGLIHTTGDVDPAIITNTGENTIIGKNAELNGYHEAWGYIEDVGPGVKIQHNGSGDVTVDSKAKLNGVIIKNNKETTQY